MTGTVPDTDEEFYARLAELSTEARWTAEEGAWSPQPASAAMLWRYADLRPLALRSAQFVRSDAAALRVMTLKNPGGAEQIATPHGSAPAVGHLYTGLQLLNPGESMTAHRHAATALRFIIEGTGAWTVIGGDRVEAGPGDFIVTPSRSWHEHGTDSLEEPVIWQDGTDDPLVNTLDANFYELHPDLHQVHGKPIDASLRAHGSALLRPDRRRATPASPLLHYPWEMAYSTLRGYAEVTDGSPYDGVLMEYQNPATGGPVTPTLGAALQMLRPGERTRAHRHTGSVVYQVAKGRGHSVIAGTRFDWAPHDIFCVPSWAWHQHANDDPDDDACLFSFTDRPVLDALGLYVEEAPDGDADSPGSPT
ncbi:cupin domain-containing protein [Amycolatopsis sp. NPDC057786]|uniref:cupin domain-containing protein n=1 Tax=Amycolatopsis sp. NPDC057786 TaxID=3346250 RepID=UPI00366FA7D4